MKVRMIIYHLFIAGLVQNQQITGSTPQTCAKNFNCSDSDCGMAGVINNWVFNPSIEQCQVIDCSQLNNYNSQVSDQSCASCNTSGTPSSNSNTQGNIYSNLQKNSCVSVNCLELQNSSQMTSAYCEICAGINSTVNSDKKTCTSVASIDNKIIIFLPFILLLSILI
ncbi:cell surface immobilization antigen (macronuclear) [Tetrahymena thermophila SB210]|uniref:Cell surface immobilization antigen n=1 Tax=Tetrahymena thermophila (strain SB210) TaxID=312017 RepID=I7LXW2_TETTS|nr:cell surface immobilization antigen [Tetrahymena thermophila SB210]EAS06308.2 cell surface immobilization antigen [Tetrahymena thermophila SB210]|eukprot:XP_001026553.2 cell surface immobilization antigen [Tetrahymena thermophila SB210]